MNKKHLIIGGVVLGVALVALYAYNKKKKSKVNPSPSTTPAVEEEADATYMASNLPDLTDGTGSKYSFNERVGIYMPRPTPEMSMDNQEIDLTI